METRSLGDATDLFFPRFEGEVFDRGEYVVVRTPRNPTFYWGNYLIFEGPPKVGDFSRWTRWFTEEIGRPSRVGHALLAWTGEPPSLAAIAPFSNAGFELVDNRVLAASRTHAPPHPNSSAVYRPLAGEAEWAAALEHQVRTREPQFEEAPYRAFKLLQMDRFRRMVEAGKGVWFGAFVEGRLVSDLGVFYEGPLGRYQAVGTDPDFRKRGLCRTLVWRAGEYARERWGVKKLVIVAETEGEATSVYASVGFKCVEHKLALLRSPERAGPQSS